MDESHKHDVQLLESGEDAPEPLKPSEQALDFIASAIHDTVILPRFNPVGFGRHNGDEAQVQRKLPGFLAFICPVHQQAHGPVGFAHCAEQPAAFGRIVGLARRQCKRYGRASIRGNHMNLGCPSASGPSDGLGAVFFNAPVPSG
jgi:hypothetical protein